MKALAWSNVAMHLLGLVFAAWAFRPGGPPTPLPERMAYLVSKPLAWTLGWFCWILCAILLVAFIASLTLRIKQRRNLARLALLIVTLGAAIDVSTDLVFIFVTPTIVGESLFLGLERATGIASLTVANGAYSIAILGINAALWLNRIASCATAMVGLMVGVLGLILAGTPFIGEPDETAIAAMVFGPLTILMFSVWVILVAYSTPTIEDSQ